MEELLESGEVDGAVTMHLPLPHRRVHRGPVRDPGQGQGDVHRHHHRHFFQCDRIEGMIKNAVYGIIAAKACGVEEPHRGHPERRRRPADRDGPQAAPEQRLSTSSWATSARADGGCVMRGNDVLDRLSGRHGDATPSPATWSSRCWRPAPPAAAMRPSAMAMAPASARAMTGW